MLPTLHGRDEYIYIYSYIKSYHIYIYIKALAQTKHYTHHYTMLPFVTDPFALTFPGSSAKQVKDFGERKNMFGLQKW